MGRRNPMACNHIVDDKEKVMNNYLHPMWCPKCAKACKCYEDSIIPKCYEPQNDLLVTEYPQDGEVNLIGRNKTEAVVMAYDVYKELTEPLDKDINVRSKTEPQIKRVETMSCQECKWWFTDSLKHGGYCQSFLYNQECRYEPQERSK